MKEENRQLKPGNAPMKRTVANMNDSLERIEKKRSSNVVLRGLKMETRNTNILKPVVEDFFIEKELRIRVQVK